jgi:saccharopine dehydrogenase (NAD+, L-lysine forming)
MKNVIGIMREGISKRGERRVGITPHYAKEIIQWGHRIIIQSAKHPKTGEIKRAFPDSDYKKTGVEISEDLSSAKVIFGLKEIHHTRILPDKAYYFFSHTHKGQIKNRLMLRTLVESRASLIDYELIRDDKENRLITAFTYNAGYAGMVDTLWTLGKRLKLSGISNPFEAIPQAVEGQDLLRVKNILKKVGHKIEVDGTPADLPPIIVCFLGKGKTAHGAREIFDILPHENITLKELEKTFKQGSRKKVYALQLRTDEIYRLRKKYESESGHYEKLILSEKRRFYKDNPEYFRSNLDKVLAYVTVLMNCVVWSPEYPRSVTKELMKNIYERHKTLIAIGDITCDPNGSIEFSKETWIDDPVYIYNPLTAEITNGFDGEGIAVMAVTNLPCEFSTDASSQFSEDLYPFLKSIISADYKGRMRDSNLPDEIKRAVILWKGKFAADFEYMKGFIEREH